MLGGERDRKEMASLIKRPSYHDRMNIRGKYVERITPTPGTTLPSYLY